MQPNVSAQRNKPNGGHHHDSQSDSDEDVPTQTGLVNAPVNAHVNGYIHNGNHNIISAPHSQQQVASLPPSTSSNGNTARTHNITENFRMTFSLCPLMFLSFFEMEIQLDDDVEADMTALEDDTSLPPSFLPSNGRRSNIPLNQNTRDVDMEDSSSSLLHITAREVVKKVASMKPKVRILKEMILVERPELDVLIRLPGAHRRTKYGM